MVPNLFNFATSELSQDAFLCWLLSWTHQDLKAVNPDLHNVGMDFLKLIFAKSDKNFPANVSSISVDKQVEAIDILCVVNSDTAILIEDKVGTNEHDDQLKRYMESLPRILEERYKKDPKLVQIIHAYIQTGDQSDYSIVSANDYCVITRKDILGVLESTSGKVAWQSSEILRQFTSYLSEMDRQINSFSTVPPAKWEWRQMVGFSNAIQEFLKTGNWAYVPNPSGGFMGFWWHTKKNNGFGLYLQLEMAPGNVKFCFKIIVDDKETRCSLRQSWSEKILAESTKHGLEVIRPPRFGNGQYMTVALLKNTFPVLNNEGLLDFQETMSLIERSEALLDSCL